MAKYFNVSPEIPAIIEGGRKVVSTAGTPETLVAATSTAMYVLITAVSTNTGVVVVGGSTVIATATQLQDTPLSAGDVAVLSIDNLIKVYIDVQYSGEGVTFTKLA